MYLLEDIKAFFVYYKNNFTRGDKKNRYSYSKSKLINEIN